MTVSFACGCGRKLRAVERAAGRSVDCPGCGRPVAVPVRPDVEAGIPTPVVVPVVSPVVPPAPAAPPERAFLSKLAARGPQAVRVLLVLVAICSGLRYYESWGVRTEEARRRDYVADLSARGLTLLAEEARTNLEGDILDRRVGDETSGVSFVVALAGLAASLRRG